MINIRKLVLQNFLKSRQFFASLTNRENHFKEYFEGKIISQYAEHISKYQKYKVADHINDLSNDLFKIEQNVNISDLSKIIHQLQQLDHPSIEFVSSINSLDEHFSKNLLEIDSQDLLTILDSFMQVVPSKITKLNCFQGIITRLSQSSPKQEDFIRICFYVGLCKKKKEARVILTKLFDRALDFVLDDKLSSLDFAIICNSSFKSVVLIKTQKFKQRLISEVIKTDLNPLTFITFIKSLRLNRIQAEEVIDTIRSLVLQNKLDDVSLCEIVHVFALLADNLVKDDELTLYFVRKFLYLMNEEKRVREKDIGTFLWCCSHLNLEIGEKDLQKIVEIILLKVNILL